MNNNSYEKKELYDIQEEKSKLQKNFKLSLNRQINRQNINNYITKNKQKKPSLKQLIFLITPLTTKWNHFCYIKNPRTKLGN